MNRLAAMCLAIAIAAPAVANQTDTDFLDGMTMHHKDGIEMAEMAIRKAVSADLRQLAEKIRDGQQKDIADFERMRSGSLQDNRPELADMPGMSAMNMQWLESKSGREFDRAFAIAMIDHHLSGIKMTDMEIARVNRATVKRKAAEIKATQRREISELARFK